MTIALLRRVIVALLVLVVTSACSGAGPIGPGPIDPGPGPNPGTRRVSWSELPPLSEEGRATLSNFSILSGVTGVKRWEGFPIPVYATSDFRRQDVVDAMDFWQTATQGKISFRLVEDPSEAKIRLDATWPPPGSSGEACGAVGAKDLNGSVYISSTAYFAFKARPEVCWTPVRESIAHEIGHILGSGHTTTDDIMSVPNGTSRWRVSSLLSEVINWVYSVPAGTIPF